MVEQMAHKVSPVQFVWALLLVGALTGGGGHMVFGQLFGSEVSSEELESIRVENRRLQERVIRLERDVGISICLNRAIREEFDWWTCYTER